MLSQWRRIGFLRLFLCLTFNAKIMKTTINKLFRFAIKLNEETLTKIFGEEKGHQYYNKFNVDYHHDFLLWYGCFLKDRDAEKLIDFFESHYIKYDEDTARFIELIELHEEDTDFDSPEDKNGWGDKDYEFFIAFANAFRHLCKERGEEWAKTHNWEFNIDSDNPYDVRIYTTC